MTSERASAADRGNGQCEQAMSVRPPRGPRRRWDLRPSRRLGSCVVDVGVYVGPATRSRAGSLTNWLGTFKPCRRTNVVRRISWRSTIRSSAVFDCVADRRRSTSIRQRTVRRAWPVRTRPPQVLLLRREPEARPSLRSPLVSTTLPPSSAAAARSRAPPSDSVDARHAAAAHHATLGQKVASFPYPTG